MHSFFNAISQAITIIPAFVMLIVGLRYTFVYFRIQDFRGFLGKETDIIRSKIGPRAIILIIASVLWALTWGWFYNLF